ncbi:hypothetical protein SNK03_011841 [Fusarium graminearum]
MMPTHRLVMMSQAPPPPYHQASSSTESSKAGRTTAKSTIPNTSPQMTNGKGIRWISRTTPSPCFWMESSFWLLSRKKVLDIGTGTGIWAIDFADEYPEAEVIGTDLSPIQPSWVPPNVKFELEDATNTWSWPDNDFDFIHIRYLIGAIADWGALFKEAFRCCKSGSYFESVEVNPLFKSDDESINNIAPIQTWNKICRESEKAFGRSLCEVENDTQLLGEVGFVDLQVTNFKVPVGGWAKDTNLQRVGQFHRAGIENDLQGYTLMTWQKVFGSPGKEYQLFLMQMRQALRDKNVHGYMRVRFITARKP